MKEVNFDGYRFMQIHQEPKIFVSIKGKNNFCSLNSLEKEDFLKNKFQIFSDEISCVLAPSWGKNMIVEKHCFNIIKNLVDKNSIGKIISVRVECGSFLPEWHPNEDYRKSYVVSDKISGGLSLTLIHELDYLMWFFGNVKEISSFEGKITNLKISISDISLTHLKFKNGVIGQIDLNLFQQPNYRSCKIFGQNAQLFWDTTSNQIKIFNYKTKKWSIHYSLKNHDSNSMYKSELKYFLNSISKNKETFNNVLDASKTMKIALLMKKSANKKRGFLTK